MPALRPLPIWQGPARASRVRSGEYAHAPVPKRERLLLADPGRVRLILALLEASKLCVCDLAAAARLSQTACSNSLRLLRSSRLVRYGKQGRKVYYALDDAHIRLLLDVALQHVTHPD
jgi:DNA-binding transcriptional ArsR family regulator